MLNSPRGMASLGVLPLLSGRGLGRVVRRRSGTRPDPVRPYRFFVDMRSPHEVAIRAPTNIVREMPRRISPPTIRGELNKPVIDIIHPRLVVC